MEKRENPSVPGAVAKEKRESPSVPGAVAREEGDTRYYNVMWCKLSKKKHKRWEEDGMLSSFSFIYRHVFVLFLVSCADCSQD